jgi:hypothetical protein
MRVLMLGRIGFVIDDPARLAPIFAKLNSVIRPLLKSPLHYVGGKDRKRVHLRDWLLSVG